MPSLRVSVLAALLVALAGCSRSFPAIEPPAADGGTALQPLGTRCDAEARGDGGPILCASGLCADGFCCERACAADERCDAVGHAGSCTPRQLGDGCSDKAQCPSGFCVDGVCCESACDQPCQTCALGLHPGICELAEDNTDPGHDCPAHCEACFGGICGPATRGTDPHRECPGGQVCAEDQSCQPAGPTLCTTDADCAGRLCLGGGCLSPEGVTQVPFSADGVANEFQVLITGFAATTSNDEALLLYDYEQKRSSETSVDVRRNQLTLYMHVGGGDWITQTVVDAVNADGQTPPYGSVAYLGRRLFMVVATPVCSGNTCGVYGRPVYENGSLGPVEPIDPDARASNDPYDAVLVQTYVEANGAVNAAWTDSRGFHLRRRTVTAEPDGGNLVNWGDVADVPRPSGFYTGTFALATWHSGPVFISGITDNAGIHMVGVQVTGIDGTSVRAEGGSFPCGSSYLATLTPARGEIASGAAHFGLDCFDSFGTTNQSWLGTLDDNGNLGFSPIESNYQNGSESAYNVTYLEGTHPARLAYSRAGTTDASVGFARTDGTGYEASTLVMSIVGSLGVAPTADGAMHLAFTVEDSQGGAMGVPKVSVQRLSP